MKIRTKRIYAPAADDDGLRVLVDRLWPRGVSKADAAVELWLRDAAPSSALRKRFGHERSRWAEFRHAYFDELREADAHLAPLRALPPEQTVTLLFAASDEHCNNAVALKAFLERHD